MIVLRILKFDTFFHIPQVFLVIYLEDYFYNHKVSESRQQKISQIAINWANDCTISPEILDLIISRKKPGAKAVALACLFMALVTENHLNRVVKIEEVFILIINFQSFVMSTLARIWK